MKDVIQYKLDSYKCRTKEEEENALKEISQEVALYSLAKCGFFKVASFIGGTCLRIVHGLDRFSEDLDFALNVPDKGLDIAPYMDAIIPIMNAYGYDIEVSGKDKEDNNARKRFIKDGSIKKIISLRHHTDLREKIWIKFELDVRPPDGATTAQKFLEFPTDFSVRTYDKESLFAGKCHALLCREYIKGRDWYDFAWYVSKRSSINRVLLANALKQIGPWEGQDLSIDKTWIQNSLSDKIRKIDWAEAIEDVSKFLTSEKKEDVQSIWSADFFLSKVEKITLV